MTREFNQNQRYGSRPPYRGSSSNNRYGAEQPSGPTRPRLNRTTVDRAWENGAPQRHADYKPRNPNEAGTNQTRYGQNSQRNWRNTQSSERSSYNHTSYEKGDNSRPSQYHDGHARPHRSDDSSNGYQGSRSAKPNNSFADRPPYRDQRSHNGEEENTYRARNGHPNFSHRPQEGNRGRYNQEQGQRGNYRNDGHEHRMNQTDRANNGTEDYRDRRSYPSNQREAPHHNDRFEGRQQTHSRDPRYPSYPANPGRQRENRNYRQREQFQGDYEQFNHAPAHQPRDGRRQDEQPSQAQAQRMGKPPEVEQHVTTLPDGRVLKGPRPVQRRNAQFWTDISQDTENLVKQVQTPETTTQEVGDEQTETNVLPTQPGAETPPAASPRSALAKRAARAARKGKTERPIAKGPKPSQRGFKWPASPSQA